MSTATTLLILAVFLACALDEWTRGGGDGGGRGDGRGGGGVRA